jgi:hypothetical protein
VKTIAYWVCTAFIGLTALAAGVADVAHLEPLYGILLHLGYPPYFAAMLGVAKIAGAAVVMSPRAPLLKEWAYAGMFCDYSAAVASHAALGDGATAIAGPLVSLGFAAASWALRPGARRLQLPEWPRPAVRRSSETTSTRIPS